MRSNHDTHCHIGIQEGQTKERQRTSPATRLRGSSTSLIGHFAQNQTRSRPASILLINDRISHQKLRKANLDGRGTRTEVQRDTTMPAIRESSRRAQVFVFFSAVLQTVRAR